MQDKGITTYEKSLPNGKIKQVFFFDPDGKTNNYLIVDFDFAIVLELVSGTEPPWFEWLQLCLHFAGNGLEVASKEDS